MLRLIDRLAARFPDRPRAGIERIVWQEHRRFDGRPVRNYVVLLVERAARDRLRGQPGLGDPAPTITPASVINSVPLKNAGNGLIVPVPDRRRRHARTY